MAKGGRRGERTRGGEAPTRESEAGRASSSPWTWDANSRHSSVNASAPTRRSRFSSRVYLPARRGGEGRERPTAGRSAPAPGARPRRRTRRRRRGGPRRAHFSSAEGTVGGRERRRGHGPRLGRWLAHFLKMNSARVIMSSSDMAPGAQRLEGTARVLPEHGCDDERQPLLACAAPAFAAGQRGARSWSRPRPQSVLVRRNSQFPCSVPHFCLLGIR